MKRVITTLLLTFTALTTLYSQSFHLFSLKNHNGICMNVTDYGARIVSLFVPDRDGNIEDIVCGYDTLQQYALYKQNYGATVGRYIGRILDASFTLDGKTYHLDAESNGHCSHGGKPGFANRIWTVVHQSSNQLTLQYISPDGESGFPGELTTRVTMTLTDDNELRLDYEATTTRPTVLNISNHSFFNLSGNLRNSILSHRLLIDADSIALYDEKKCVTGKLSNVKDTPLDFLTPHPVGTRIDADHPQLKVTGGYDHCYLLNHPDLNHPSASIYDPESGRMMEVLTTEPALQIYSGNGLKANSIGKSGIAYARRSAICFETMHFADSPNKPQWPSTVLRPGETYRSTTIFKFSTLHDTPQGLTPSEKGYVPVTEDGKIYYESYGQGTPLILLHGHTLDRRMWRQQIEAFSPYYRVITPDMRGYGLSSKLREDLHTTHVDDIITLMDSLHIDRAHVVGLSMGGFIASDMVAMYPERMLSCVLSSGNLRNMKGPSSPLDAEERAKQKSKIDDAALKGITRAKQEWTEQLITGGGSYAEQMRDELTSIISDWDAFQLTHYEPHLWYANEAKPHLEARKPSVPTLFLSGETEHKKRTSMMKFLPRSDFQVIPDCGHMSNLERPDIFNRIILDFLSAAAAY